jgi:hypothetical protein
MLSAQPTQATTAIVFERLSPESREPTKVAALKMLEGRVAPFDPWSARLKKSAAQSL